MMKISDIIDLLEGELTESGDSVIMIYNSSGELIQPDGFSFGGMSTDQGFVDTVSFQQFED